MSKQKKSSWENIEILELGGFIIEYDKSDNTLTVNTKFECEVDCIHLSNFIEEIDECKTVIIKGPEWNE